MQDTPLKNIKQATTDLLGIMGSYRYNRVSLNLSKLVSDNVINFIVIYEPLLLNGQNLTNDSVAIKYLNEHTNAKHNV